MDRPKAGFLRRFVAVSIDCLLLEVLGAIITYPLDKRFDLTTAELLESLASGGGDLKQELVYLLLYSVILTLLWTFYFTYFIGYAGQTPGKKLLGIAVIRTDGKPMTYKTAFNRFAGYSVSGGVFFLGFIWALFDRDNRTWHDKMAHTIVVRQIP